MAGEVIFEPLPARTRKGGRPKGWRPGVVKVKEPPRRVGHPGAKWKQQLRARPDEWARLPIKGHGGRLQKISPGFEFAIRTVDGDRRVYGRYVGEVRSTVAALRKAMN